MRHHVALTAIALLAVLYGAFFVATIPPWDVYDESTHLAYVLVLRDERRIPHLEEMTRQDVVDAEIRADRWARFQIGEPDTSSLEAMGLGGRLYQGYQPPLYYAAIIPVTYLGRDVTGTMYFARLAGPFFLAALAVLTWILGRLWFPRSGALMWGSAAFMIAVTPAAASAAGRVNNDLLAAVLICAGLVAASLLAQRPTPVHALALSISTSLAVLTKAHGMLLLPVSVAVLLLLWRSNRLSWILAVLALIPSFMASAVWTTWTWNRYGTLSGTEAFLAFARPFEPLTIVEFCEAIIFATWSSYFSTYDGGMIGIAAGFGLVVIVVVGIVSLARTGSVPTEVIAITGVVALVTVAILWYGNSSGLVYPQGRILLPVLPVAYVLAVEGWHRIGFSWSAIVPAGLAIAGSLLFTLGWFIPFFH